MQGREQNTISQFTKFSSRSPAWPRSVAIEMALEQRAIGRRIAELREDRRLTQPVVAERVGVSLRGYQKWEAGTAAPGWANLESLAKVFKVSADFLLGAATEEGQNREAQLDRIEEKLDEVLRRFNSPGEEEDDAPPAPARRPKPRPPLPSRPSKRAPRKRSAGSG